MSQMYTVLVEIERDHCVAFELHNLKKEETYAFDSPQTYYESFTTFKNTAHIGDYLYKDIPYKKYLEYKKIIKRTSNDHELYKSFKYTTFRTLVEGDFPELLI